MTIEEYLRKRIGDLEEGPCNSSLVQGKILAYREILSKLPEMEHEVTVKEIKEMCQSYIGIGGCMKCPLNENSYAYNCIAVGMPLRLEPDAIQRRMKYEEERHNN